MFSIDTIWDLYRENDPEIYFGEEVTLTDHMLQCAYVAKEAQSSDEVVLASFFHDVGHFLPNNKGNLKFGNMQHEYMGANFLASNGISAKICHLVANHVAAKRYLCAKRPHYFGDLSNASRQTLNYQGGPMVQKEIEVFESDMSFKDIINLRLFDECAKQPGAPKLTLDEMWDLTLKFHLSEQQC